MAHSRHLIRCIKLNCVIFIWSYTTKVITKVWEGQVAISVDCDQWIRRQKTAMLSDRPPFKPVLLKPQLKDISEFNKLFIRVLKFCVFILVMILKIIWAYSECSGRWAPHYDLRFSFGMYLMIKVRPTSPSLNAMSQWDKKTSKWPEWLYLHQRSLNCITVH